MIEVKNLVKTFREGEIETKVLRGIDFRAERGEYISIIGRSGAGKSTFLYQMSLLDDPTSGDIIIEDRNTKAMNASQKTHFRLTQFGYVFQDYALLPELTGVENVLLPLLMQSIPMREARKLTETALTRLKLAHRMHSLPSHMSG